MCNRSLLFSSRGTEKLKELTRKPETLERVEQLLNDSDLKVQKVNVNIIFPKLAEFQ